VAKKRNSKIDQLRFTLDYWKDGSWFVGRLREVPSVISQGKTLTELKANIVDAYRLVATEERTSIPVDRYQTTTVGLSL
jgi:predicted RNase H-like HicB family nuclease